MARAKNENENMEAVEETVSEDIQTIEKHAEKLGISKSILEGMKAYQGWAEGKELLEKEFQKALEEFLGSPIDGGGQ